MFIIPGLGAKPFEIAFEDRGGCPCIQTTLFTIVAANRAISFTYGDRLLAFNDDYRDQSGEKYKNSLCKTVFLLGELQTLFACAEYPKDDPLKIEVQLWAIPSEVSVRIIAR